ncbi:MAG: leucine-rich repeat protein [Oscillospiraceae bacterium]|nr:leucine-rich repeat protein [Oscillospiraceae bacterium]
MKKLTCFALAVLIMLGLCSYAAAADETASYEGAAIAAVNTLYSTVSNTEGYFTVPSDSALLSLEGGEERGVYDIYKDDETGEIITVLEPDLPLPQPIPEGDAPLKNAVSVSSEYTPGSTFTLTENNNTTKNSMVCLYVGTNCTVWGSVSDDEAIRLGEENAKAIGEAFDKDYDRMSAAFGSYHYDADLDGKVAIMCYDIDHEYGYGDPLSYTAGYFWATDMISSSGRVNGVYYGENSYINGIDCVHIDTYPTMGKEASLFSRVENCYSTLFHEYQHMINYSNNVKNGASGFINAMETYLNEAFSMAAQHYIYGSEATSGRVSYFNGSSYTPGTSLTRWGGTLSNYANSYLFGQYLRTRWAQKTGSDGWDFYSKVISLRTPENEDDTLGIITDMLSTTHSQLILDFWTAVYKKEATGVHGFLGEEWAEVIDPKIYDSFSNTGGIYPGGAKFYLLKGEFEPTESENLNFIPFGSIHSPEVLSAKALRLSETEGKFNLTANKSGTIYYRLVLSSVQYPSYFSSYPLTAGSEFSLPLPSLSGYSEYKVYYYIEDCFGNTTDIQYVDVPAWYYTVTVNECEGGRLILRDGAGTVTSGDYVVLGTTLSIGAVAEEGKELKAVYLDGKKLTQSTFTVSGAHTLSARFGKEDIPAASSFSSGDGTEESPYLISSPAELKYFAQRVNSGDTMQGKYIALAACLDMDGAEISPIGSADSPFKGSFDGGGCEVNNLFIETNKDCAGLFGYLEGSVQNLIMKNCTVSADEAFAGAVAGYNKGTVKRCIVEDCEVYIEGSGSAGGICGASSGEISLCQAFAAVSAAGDSAYLGGITGQNENTGRISDCLVNLNINAGCEGTVFAGGAAGLTSGSVSGCYVAEGSIYAVSQGTVFAGGIAGSAQSAAFENCVSNIETINIVTEDGENSPVDQIAAKSRETSYINCFYSASTLMSVNSYSADSEAFGKEASASELASGEFLSKNTGLDFSSSWEWGTHPELSYPTLSAMRTLLGVKIRVSECKGGSVTPDYEIAYIGQKITLKSSAIEYFSFDSFTLDGAPLSENSFTVTGEHTVGAVFTLTYEGGVDGGLTGDVTWVFTEDNELIICGAGAMADYARAEDRPWHCYCDKISKITVDDRVTHIGSYAAAGCTSLYGAAFPEGVLSLGNGVFDGSSVSDVILPSSVVSVGNIFTSSLKNVFYNASEEAWQRVNAPDSISSLVRFGLPAAIRGTELLDAYPINGAVTPGAFMAVMENGEKYPLGKSVSLGEYDFSKTGSAAVPISFLGLEYEHKVTVYKDRHVNIKKDGSAVTVTFYGNGADKAIAAIYKDGKMLSVKCLSLPQNAAQLTFELNGTESTVKVFTLGEGSVPLDGKTEITL